MDSSSLIPALTVPAGEARNGFAGLMSAIYVQPRRGLHRTVIPKNSTFSVVPLLPDGPEKAAFIGKRLEE